MNDDAFQSRRTRGRSFFSVARPIPLTRIKSSISRKRPSFARRLKIAVARFGPMLGNLSRSSTAAVLRWTGSSGVARFACSTAPSGGEVGIEVEVGVEVAVEVEVGVEVAVEVDGDGDGDGDAVLLGTARAFEPMRTRTKRPASTTSALMPSFAQGCRKNSRRRPNRARPSEEGRASGARRSCIIVKSRRSRSRARHRTRSRGACRDRSHAARSRAPASFRREECNPASA